MRIHPNQINTVGGQISSNRWQVRTMHPGIQTGHEGRGEEQSLEHTLQSTTEVESFIRRTRILRNRFHLQFFDLATR